MRKWPQRTSLLPFNPPCNVAVWARLMYCLLKLLSLSVARWNAYLKNNKKKANNLTSGIIYVFFTWPASIKEKKRKKSSKTFLSVYFPMAYLLSPSPTRLLILLLVCSVRSNNNAYSFSLFHFLPASLPSSRLPSLPPSNLSSLSSSLPIPCTESFTARGNWYEQLQINEW